MTVKGVEDCIVDARADMDMDTVNQAVASNAEAEIYCHPDDLSRLDRVDTQSEEARALFHVSADPTFDTGTDGVNQPPKRKRHRRYTRQ